MYFLFQSLCRLCNFPIAINLPLNFLQISQHGYGEHVGRNQVPVSAGVITGTKTGPNQARTGFYQRTFSISGKGIPVITVMAAEAVRGFFLMVLLGSEHL